jgi:hypothetical protein
MKRAVEHERRKPPMGQQPGERTRHGRDPPAEKSRDGSKVEIPPNFADGELHCVA